MDANTIAMTGVLVVGLVGMVMGIFAIQHDGKK